MASPGIVFEGVWKKFRRGERHDSLRDLIPTTLGRVLGRARSRTDLNEQEFWAVRDVSFEVNPGEALGIIGPNGAGKSTTLKLLTRIIKPTRGRCAVRGRAGALIEVAAGFHPDLTGRENIFLQGAIMGMKRVEIRARFDDIVDFAGISAFIDTQVKRFSSGMNARLGFAIAAHLNPDVMIIDEVLSVGDAAFQQKCIDHLRTMVRRGVPLAFVTHNLSAILELCSRVIVVEKGTVMFDGEPAEAVMQYRRASWRASAAPQQDANKPIRITQVEFRLDGESALGAFRTNDELSIRIHYEAIEPVRQPHFAVDIHRGEGTHCYGSGTFQHHDFGTLEGRGAVDLTIPRLSLLSGSYMVSVGIHRGDGQGLYDLHQNAYPFSVSCPIRDLGIVALGGQWSRVEPAAPVGATRNLEG